MKKKTLFLIILVCLVLMATLVSSVVLAVSPDDIGSKIQQPKDTGITDTGKKIMAFIQVIGIIVSVAILMVLGVKYMMGSAEEKAEYKKVFIPYIIGAILLFSATTIANAVYNAVKDNQTTQSSPVVKPNQQQNPVV